MTHSSIPAGRDRALLPALALVAALAATLAAGAPLNAQQPLTLAEAASSALRTHPSAAAAAARARGAAAGRDAARASRLPGVDLEAGMTRFQEPMIVAPLHSFDVTNRPRFDETLVQGRLGAAYTVFDGGARGARIEGADAAAASATHAAVRAEMELLAEVAASYVEVLTGRALLTAAALQEAALASELDRAQRQVEAGTAPRVQLLRARASVEDARAQKASAASRVGLVERGLARLMGVAPADVVGRPLVDVAPTRAISKTPSGPDASPAVAAAARMVDAAAASVAVERASRLPRLATNAALLDFGTPTGDHVLEWQAGVQLSFPVYTGGARSASLRRAEAGLREAEAELDAVRLQADRAEDAARTAITASDARVQALQASVSQWTEVARIEALALETGAGIQSDLLRAQAGLFQATAGLARARGDAVVARVELARTRGVLDMEWINEQLESR